MTWLQKAYQGAEAILTPMYRTVTGEPANGPTGRIPVMECQGALFDLQGLEPAPSNRKGPVSGRGRRHLLPVTQAVAACRVEG